MKHCYPEMGEFVGVFGVFSVFDAFGVFVGGLTLAGQSIVVEIVD